MTDVFSDAGRWQYFGVLTALPTWQNFELESPNTTTFELIFLTDWSLWENFTLKFKSYCLIRHAYKKGFEYKVVDVARKVYLSREPQLIELPVPIELQGEPELLRVPSFRYQTFSRSAMQTPEVVIPWELSLRALFPV
jgi:hypothetical protein